MGWNNLCDAGGRRSCTAYRRSAPLACPAHPPDGARQV